MTGVTEGWAGSPTGKEAWRNALFCALVAVLATLATCPFVEAGVSDDPSYNYTVKVLAETGRFTYNGWAAMTLGFQVYWAALFVKIFGFSIVCVRLSMLPFVAGCAILLYFFGHEAALRPAYAKFLSLSVVLTPLFLSVAPTFMTDVSGTFFQLLSVLCFYYALKSGEGSAEKTSVRASWSWLTAAGLSGILGGSIRQVIFGVVIITALFVAARFLAKRQMGLALYSLALTGILVGTMAAMGAWFRNEPYACVIDYGSMVAALAKIKWHYLINLHTSFFLTLVQMQLPAALGGAGMFLAGWLRESRHTGKWLIFGGAIMMVLAAIGLMIRVSYSVPFYKYAYWFSSVAPNGQNTWSLPGMQPDFISDPVLMVLYVAVVIGAVCVTAIFLQHLWTVKWSVWRFLFSPGIFPVLTVATLCSAALTILAAFSLTRIDRYLLPILPYFGLLIWRVCQERRERPPLAAWLLLFLVAYYGIGAQQRYFSAAQARIQMVQRLVDRGIPRSQIEAGFDLDSWFHLEKQGYFNNDRIKNPPDAYKPGHEVRLPFYHPLEPKIMSHLIQIKPRYFVVLQPQEGLQNIDGVTPQEYASLLPPFRHQVFAQEIKK